MNARYATIERATHFEIEKVKASRFLADAFQVADEREAEAGVKQIRREHHDARHHAWAYRLGPEGARFRSSDDGEPSGSAGRPILQQIETRALADVLVVVTRWFGGTKLGVGGLVRAYGAAAAAVLDRAGRQERILTCLMEVAFPYECTAVVQGLLAQLGAVPKDARYDAGAVIACEVAIDRVEELVSALRERTANRATCRRLSPTTSTDA